MTPNEMKYNMLLFYDKLFEYGAPDYDDRQISAILTKAQIRVFKRHYMPQANKFQMGFEQSEQRRRDLEQFIKNASISNGEITESAIGEQAAVHPNGTLYDMPSDFLYAIEEALVTDVSAPEEITVVPIVHDYYRANIRNPYKQPYKNLAWRMDYSRETPADGTSDPSSKRTEIITDSTSTISEYRVRYLISPPEIIVDVVNAANQKHCILDATLHDEIVDEAVKIAKAATMPDEYQIAQIEQKESES